MTVEGFRASKWDFMNLWLYLPRSIYSVLLVLHLFNFEIFCCKTVMLSDSILQEDIHTFQYQIHTNYIKFLSQYYMLFVAYWKWTYLSSANSRQCLHLSLNETLKLCLFCYQSLTLILSRLRCSLRSRTNQKWFSCFPSVATSSNSFVQLIKIKNI